MGDKVSPVDIAKAAIKQGRNDGNNVIIIDTAGRLHIDEELMQELKDVKSAVEPNEILLVVDSMTLDVSGVILTKLDGDTRGGAALSIRSVTEKPIKFIGVGEKMSDFEVFHPERMASRILGMGDVLSLIEKAQEAIDEKEAGDLAKKMMTNELNFEDFLTAMEQMKKLGPLNKIMEMIPGMESQNVGKIDFEKSEKQLDKTKAIIQSMTLKERRNPSLLIGSSSRKKRVALGAGTTIQEVNKLIKGYEAMKKQMKQVKSLTKKSRKGLFGKMPFMS